MGHVTTSTHHVFYWTDSVDVTVVSDDADEGYILEVDLEYPAIIHDLRSDYPLAPESITVTPDMLSPTVRNWITAVILWRSWFLTNV